MNSDIPGALALNTMRTCKPTLRIRACLMRKHDNSLTIFQFFFFFFLPQNQINLLIAFPHEKKAFRFTDIFYLISIMNKSKPLTMGLMGSAH